MFPKNREPTPWRRSSGFTLIEVVLALAVISFAVVALLGLLSVSAGSSRSASEDTVIASMSRQVIAEMRSKPFSSLPTKSEPTQNDPGWPVATTTTDSWPAESGDPPSPPPTYLATLYFDNEGRRLPNAAGAVYQCRVKFMADPNSLTDSPAPLPDRTNLYRVRLAFSAVNGTILQTVRTAISRHE